MSGNHALDTNAVVGDHADLTITTHGSDWYWTVCALMALSTFTLMGLSYTKRQTHRLFHYTTAGITLVASISYYSMAAGLGQTAIQVEFVRSDLNEVAAAGTRQIFWVRYVDYAITTPLILTNLFLTASIPRPTMLATLLADELMVVCYLAGALTQTGYKWGYFVFGLFAYFFVVYSLVFDGRRYASALGGVINKTFLTCTGLTVFIWFLYPIAWGISEGGNVIHPDSEAIFYGILDICSKIVVGFLLVLGHKKIDPAELGLHIREHSTLPRHEKHGARRDHGDHSDHSDHRKGVGNYLKEAVNHRNGVTDHRKEVTDHHNAAPDHNHEALDHRDRTTDHHKGVLSHYNRETNDHHSGSPSYYHRDTKDHHRRGGKASRGGIMGLFQKGNRHNDTDHEYRARDRGPVTGGYHHARQRSPDSDEYPRDRRSHNRGGYHPRDRGPATGGYQARERSPDSDEYPRDRRDYNRGDYYAREHSPNRAEYRAGQRSPIRGGHRKDEHHPLTGSGYHPDGRRSFPGDYNKDGRRSFPGGEHHGDGRRSFPGEGAYGDGRRSAPGGEYYKDGRRSPPGVEDRTGEPRSMPGVESHRQNIRSVPGGEYQAGDRRSNPGPEHRGEALRPALGPETHGENHQPMSGDQYRPDNRALSARFQPDNQHPSNQVQEPQGSNLTASKPILPSGTEYTGV